MMLAGGLLLVEGKRLDQALGCQESAERGFNLGPGLVGTVSERKEMGWPRIKAVSEAKMRVKVASVI